MEKEDIKLGDINRILFGNLPPEFLLEVFIRTLIIYVSFLLVMRWLGKRMAGQLTILELGVMLTLGAIVAPAMQAPNVGVLIGIFILLCVLGFQQGLTFLSFKSKKIDELTQGKVRVFIKDGVLVLDEMKIARVTRQQVYAILRNKGIFNLGDVERMYIEASGEFSIFKSSNTKPGLPLYPPNDREIGKEQPNPDVNLKVCISCGYVDNCEDGSECNHCHQRKWTSVI
ncbi:MAG: YetF domain-containing protein [Leeuwenhoekiella sp.]